MWYQKITLPAPFHRIELFSILEPAQTEGGQQTFVHNLYLVSPSAEGGRVLLKRHPVTAINALHRQEGEADGVTSI